MWSAVSGVAARYSDEKVARIVTVGNFGWKVAHAAVSRRPPISLDTMVPRTRMYTHAAKVWDLSIVQGPVSVAPSQSQTLRFAAFHRCTPQTQYPPRDEIGGPHAEHSLVLLHQLAEDVQEEDVVGQV
jgi:hypothetical protein